MLDVLALALSVQITAAHGIRPSTGHVFVVDPLGWIPTIQRAVELVEDGDTILVKAGVYGGFTIQDKGVSVAADAGEWVEIRGPVVIENLSPGKSLLFAGFVLGTQGDAPPLTVRSDAGGVRIEECTIGGTILSWRNPNQPAVVLDEAADVALVRCSLRGGDGVGGGVPDGLPGQPALRVLSSSAALFECGLVGGKGRDGWGQQGSSDGGNGGPGGGGLFVSDGFVFGSGSEIQAGLGGRGGDNTACASGGYPGDGGPGGSGVEATSVQISPAVILLATPVTAGAGGAGGIDHSSNGAGSCWGDGQHGLDGTMVSAAAGDVQFPLGPARTMTAPRVARENETITANCRGMQGDVVQILASSTTGFVQVPTIAGVQLIPLSQSVVIASGTVSAEGFVLLQVPLAKLARDSRTIFLQAYFRDTSNQRYAASQVTLLELDSRF